MPRRLELYKQVQLAARAVLEEIPGHITQDSTEESIAATCVKLLANHGIGDTWYYSAPAFVLLGSRSCLSISGRDYVAAAEPVGQINLVTIDLSPLLGTTWGDLARSFAVESGSVTDKPIDTELTAGLSAERSLHSAFLELVRPESTFEDVFEAMNREIATLGFVNLDFMGNVGHSIVERREDRIYFESGSRRPLSDVGYFTFEPHIRKSDGRWGFKHENIYYFDEDGRICEL